MDDRTSLAVLGLGGLVVVGGLIGAVFLFGGLARPKWEAGDKIFCWEPAPENAWGAFYIAELATLNGILSYHVYEGHPPGTIFDSGWFAVSEVDSLNCHEAGVAVAYALTKPE